MASCDTTLGMKVSELNTALITAVASLLVSLLTAIGSYLAKRKSESELARLNDELASSRAERDAQRDYEYEAKKRLYTELQPLLFQLVELSEAAYTRVLGLAGAARRGNLRPDRENWLGSITSYYSISTVYRLMAPLVVFRLSQRRLTIVDLSVDPHVRNQYLMAKLLYATWTEGFELAASEPSIAYDPNFDSADPDRALRDPIVHAPQHILFGYLDQIIEVMMVQDSDKLLRCMTFGEFEEAYRDERSKIRARCQRLAELFVGFQPAGKPVLWRIILAQACLHKALINSFNNGTATTGDSIDSLTPQDRHQLDWREERSGVSSEEAVDRPLAAVQTYLRRRIIAPYVRPLDLMDK